MPILPNRVYDLRTKWAVSQERMGKILGVTGKYVGMIERGEKTVDEESSLGLLIQVMEAFPTSPSTFGDAADGPAGILMSGPIEDVPAPRLTPPFKPYAPGSSRVSRMIPLIGWAHAGDMASYEEIPKDWQALIPTDCPDKGAYGIILEGDSMEPLFHDGDRLTLMPTTEVHNGSLCVIRFKNDGVLLRKVEILPETVRLIPLNKDYTAREYEKAEIAWMYRVYGSWTQVYR